MSAVPPAGGPQLLKPPRPSDGSCQASERTHVEPRRSSSHSAATRPRPAKPSALPVALGREMLGVQAAAAHAHSECGGADGLMPGSSPAKGKKGVRKVKRRAVSTGPVAAEGDKAGGPGEWASFLDEAANQMLDLEGRMGAGAAERQVEALLSQHLDQIRAARAAEQRVEELIDQHLSEIRARRQDGGPAKGADGAALEADLLHLVAELAAMEKSCHCLADGKLQAEAPACTGARALEGTEFAGEEQTLTTASEPAAGRRPAGWRRMMGRLPLVAALGWSAPAAPRSPQKAPAGAAAAAAAPPPVQFEVERWAARVRRAHAGAAPKPAGGAGWSLEGWLRSGPAPAELARVLSRQLGAEGDAALQLAFARALPELSGPEAVRDLLHRSAALDALAAALCAAARELQGPGGTPKAAAEQPPGSWRKQVVADLARGQAAEGQKELASNPSWAGLRAYFGQCWAAVHRELVAVMQQDIARTAAGPAGAAAADTDDGMMQSIKDVLDARRRWGEPHRAAVEAAGAALRRAGGKEEEAAAQVAALLGSFDDIVGLLRACAGDEKLLSQALERLPSASSPAVLRCKILDYRERAATRNGFLECLAGILATPECLQGETECWEELHLLAACAGPGVSTPWFFRRALQIPHWTWTPPDLVSQPGQSESKQLTHAAVVIPAKVRHMRFRFSVQDSADKGALVICLLKKDSEKVICNRITWPGLQANTVKEVNFSPSDKKFAIPEEVGAEQGDTLALDYESGGSTFAVRHIRVALAPEDDFVKLLSDTARGISQLSQKGATLKLLRMLVFAGTDSTSELADLDSFFSSLWGSLGRRGSISPFHADQKRLQDVVYAKRQYNKIGKEAAMKHVRKHLEEDFCTPECTQARFDEESVLALLLATLATKEPQPLRDDCDARQYALLMLHVWEAKGTVEENVRLMLAGSPPESVKAKLPMIASVYDGLKHPVPFYLREGNIDRVQQLQKMYRKYNGPIPGRDGSREGLDARTAFSLLALANTDSPVLDLNIERIRGCEAASGAVEALVGISPLPPISAINCGIGAAGAQGIAEALRLTHITQLFLGGNSIGDEGARAIAGALDDEQVQLTALDLSSCGIGPCGGRALAGALGKNEKLRSLWLHGNPLGAVDWEETGPNGTQWEKPRFAAVVVKALRDNHHSALRALWVQNCGLEEEELAMLEAFGKSRGSFFYRY